MRVFAYINLLFVRYIVFEVNKRVYDGFFLALPWWSLRKSIFNGKRIRVIEKPIIDILFHK